MSTEYINPQWRLPNEKTGNNQSYSMDFNGVQATVASNFTAFNGAEAASFSLWYKTSTAMQGKCLISFPNTSSGNRLDLYIYTSSLPSQSPPRPGLRAWIITSGGDPTHGSNLTSTATGLSLADGNWHNVIVAWDGTTINMYYDGVNIGSMAKNGSLTSSSVDTLNIGMFGSGSYPNYFTGQIKDVAVFDYGLPATGTNSVATIYGNGTPFNPMALSSPPINYYPLGNSAHMGSNYLTPNGALQDYVFDFDGINDYIDISSSNSYGFGTGDFTISMWLYRETSSYSFPYIMDFRESTSAYNQNRLAIYYQESNGKLRCYINGSDVLDGSTGSALPLNSWFHLVLVRDSGTLSFYVDAVVDQTTSNSDNLLSTNQVNLGRRYDADRYFNGELSNIQVFNTALSSTELETLYNNGSPIQTLSDIPQNSNLKAWYKLDASEIYNSTSTEWQVNQATADYTSSLSFPGVVGDLLKIPNSSTFIPTSNLTISFWVNHTTTTSNRDARVFSIAKSASAESMYLMDNTNGSLRFTISSSSGNSDTSTAIAVNDGKWHNVVCTWDASGNIKVYTDNGTPSINTNTGTLTIPASTDMGVGGKFTGTGNIEKFAGLISNGSVWNKALSASEVSEVYNSGQPGNLSSHSASSNLVAWWKMDNLTTGIQDSSTNSNNGTAFDLSVQPGSVSTLNGLSSGMSQSNLVQSDLLTTSSYSPYALAFDGNDYIDCGNSADFSFGNGTTDSPFSTSFWFKLNSNSGTQPFLSKDNVTKEWTISIFGGGGIRIFLKNQGSNNQQSIDSTTTFSTGVWYHAVTTYDGRGGANAADGLSIYINGSLDTPTNVIKNSYTAMSSSSSDVTIGKYGGSYINGVMANVSIWNTALTSSQVTELYNEGRPSNLHNFSGTAPVAWWQLGSNSSWTSPAWTVLDEIGSNDGTSQSMLENAIVDGVGTSGNGVSTNMALANNISGSSPNGEGNSLSVNMTLANIAGGVN